MELGCESWTSFASGCSSTAVQRTLSLWLCPSTAVETAVAQCTSRWAMARGHRLNTSTVLAATTVSPVFFGRYPRSSLHSFVPPPVPVPNKPSRFCGRKAKWTHTHSNHRANSTSQLPEMVQFGVSYPKWYNSVVNRNNLRTSWEGAGGRGVDNFIAVVGFKQIRAILDAIQCV